MGQAIGSGREPRDKSRLQAIEVTVFDHDIELIRALAEVLSIDDAASAHMRSVIAEILVAGEMAGIEGSLREMLPLPDRDMH